MRSLRLFSLALTITSLLILTQVSFAQPESKLIDNWLVLGSFKCDTIHQALDITFLENEPHIFPEQGETDVASGYTWQTYSVDKKGILDFLKLELPYSEYCVVYAVTYIYSPTEKNIKLLVGSDDGIGMWINGNEIHRKVVWRGVNPRGDVVPVRLSAGWNRLLAKVFNAGGGFSLIGEIVELDNSLPTDLIFSTKRPQSFTPVGTSPFPFISSVKLGKSYFENKTNQRIFPVEVTVCNLGEPGKQEGILVTAWGEKQNAMKKFSLEKLANLSISLNSDDVLQALTSGIKIRSFINKKKYDEKLLHIEPTDVLTSIFKSDQLPGEALALRPLYNDFAENSHWFSYFSGKEAPVQRESLMACARAALHEDWDTFLQISKTNFKELNEFSKEIKKDTLHLIGQSHIDLAWKWRWQETIDVCRRTYQSALNFFDEEPDYKYIQSSAQAFLWMEESFPELFKALQEKVKEGRFFLTGGMWVEPDLNIPNGESLVRQFLYGKRYFREKFGVDCVVGYTPDTFGYAWMLPQILTKAGFKYFVTTKIRWNDTTEFPYHLFWWHSPDGSKILTSFPLRLNVGLDLKGNADDLVEYKKQNLTDVPLLYGIGDHGGGPTRQHFAKIKKMQNLAAYPTAYHNDLRSYMERVERKYTDLPDWKDELYLEYHRGTITTQGLIKKRNRLSEIWLEEAEKLAVFSGMDYPQADLEEAWKKALFNQFHDILPGSSIPEVYIDANEFYDRVEETTQKIINAGINTISTKIKTTGEGLPVVVFNPLSWNRTDLVDLRIPEDMTIGEIVDSKNKECVFQQNDDQVLFIAADVPQSGYKTFWLRQGKPGVKTNSLMVTETTLENQYFRIEINPGNGNIRSMYDKLNRREVFARGEEGNALQFFEDKPIRYGAWNIGYTGKEWQAEKVEKVEIRESGQVRAILRYTRVFRNSRFIQDYIVYRDIPRLDVHTHADWHEHHILLKAAFPVAVQADEATYEIAYGTIQRTTHPKTEAEKAKWEVSAHKFVDLSEPGYGVSLLNDCKYGHDIVGNMMRITLLRSPLTPDPLERPKGYMNPYADMGEHEFVYSLYPHSGDYKQAFSYRRAYELNYPLIVKLAEQHKGKLAAECSFIKLEPANLVLSAVKKAEDSNTKIIRLYEIHGQPAEAKLTFAQPVKSAWETNLMEERKGQLPIFENTITFSVKPFEIFTLEVE
jgi:alpha-mannosidase